MRLSTLSCFLLGLLVVVLFVFGDADAAPIRSWSVPQSSVGDIRVYVDQDTTGMPTAVGLRVSEYNVFQPPSEEVNLYFEMPGKGQRVTPFVEIDYEFMPATKKEGSKYAVHFYMLPKGGSLSRVTPGPCNGISIEGWCRSTELLPAACCPAGYTQSGNVEPFMGSHLIYPPDFSGTFTKTLMFGTLDSMIHFYALEVTTDYLVNTVAPAGSVCTNIPGMPSEFKFAGYYPTTYCLTYSTTYGAYFFELNNFVAYLPGCKGVANSCALPSSVDVPKKCNCNKAFPSFVPVPPPAGTGLTSSTSAASTTSSTHSHTTTGSTMSTMSSTTSAHTTEHTSMDTMGSHTSESSMHTTMHTTMGMGNGTTNETSSSSSTEDMGFLVLIAQPSIHLLYMISLAIIGFFFLIIAISFSLYGTSISVALIRAEKNNRQLSLILKMIFITGLLTCIFAARCGLIIWEDLVHRHEVDSNYLWRSYFLPEIIPALLILLLDVLQIFNEKKKAIAATMATLGFTSKTRDSSASATATKSSGGHTKDSAAGSVDSSTHSSH